MTSQYHHPLPSSCATIYTTEPTTPPAQLRSQTSSSSNTPGSRGSDGRGRRKPVPDLNPIDVGKAQRVGRSGGAVVVRGPSTSSSSTSTLVDTPTDQRRHRPFDPSAIDLLSPPLLAALPPVGPTIKKKSPPPPPLPPSAPSPIFATIEPTHRYASWIENGYRPNASLSKRETLGIQDGTVLHNILLTPSWGLSPTTAEQHAQSSSSYSNESLVSPPDMLPHQYRKRESLLDRAADLLAARRLRFVKMKGADRPAVGGSGYCAPSPVEMGIKERRQVDLSDMEEYRRKYGNDDDGSRGFWGGKDKEDKVEKKGSVMRFLFARNHRNKKSREEPLIKKKRRRLIYIAITSTILVAIIVSAVCTSLLTKSTSGPVSSALTNSTTSQPSTSPAAIATPTGATAYTLASCLSLFALSAPASPLTYPCDACSSILASATNDFLSGAGANTTGVGAALQFCALKDIYTSTGAAGTTTTFTGTMTSSAITPSTSALSGWMTGGTNVCSNWSGVICDSGGRVTGLSLVYPAVPSRLSASLGNLVSLKTLNIVGNNAIPSGTIPPTLFTPASLSSITIQSTSLTSISTNTLTSLGNLLSLALVSNAKLGSTLPLMDGNGKLLTLVVTGQSLTGDPFTSLPSSLTYLDLSYNSLSGSIPDLTRLSSLSSLFLDSNTFTTLPPSFPSSLQDLSIQSNPSLGGILPTALCTSTLLSACDLRGTSLAPSNKHNTTSTLVVTQTTRSGNSTMVGTQTSVATSVATAASCGSCVFT